MAAKRGIGAGTPGRIGQDIMKISEAGKDPFDGLKMKEMLGGVMCLYESKSGACAMVFVPKVKIESINPKKESDEERVS